MTEQILMNTIGYIPDRLSPGDMEQVVVDITSWLETDLIVNVEFTAEDSHGNDATADVLDLARSINTGGEVKPYLDLQGAAIREQYVIKCDVSTDANDRKAFYIVFRADEPRVIS